MINNKCRPSLLGLVVLCMLSGVCFGAMVPRCDSGYMLDNIFPDFGDLCTKATTTTSKPTTTTSKPTTTTSKPTTTTSATTTTTSATTTTTSATTTTTSATTTTTSATSTTTSAATTPPLPVPDLPPTSPWYGNEEIRIFREYLRIPTVHPNINYEPCVEFLKRQAAELNLPVTVFYPVNDKNPVVVISWYGSQPDLPSIMLNSHTDVVPVFQESWTHPAFAADVDETGKIFARGTQDTKGLGMIHLAAIRALKRSGIQLKRTIHVTFTPDEELGGFNGMAGFVLSEGFKAMNVGYALDEGGVASTNTIGVFYDERCPWQMEFVCSGPTGHASLLLENTAGEKITYLMSKFMEMRKVEVEKMKSQVPYGKVTSINLTILKGGVQANVIPPEYRAVFDVRLGVDVDHDAFERQINTWCEEAGGGITINYIVKTPKAPATRTDATNPLWAVIENTVKEFNITVVPTILVGATDMRFLRRENIPGFGFSPIINTPLLVHGNDEFVQADQFLAGISVFIKILTNLGKI